MRSLNAVTYWPISGICGASQGVRSFLDVLDVRTSCRRALISIGGDKIEDVVLHRVNKANKTTKSIVMIFRSVDGSRQLAFLMRVFEHTKMLLKANHPHVHPVYMNVRVLHSVASEIGIDAFHRVCTGSETGRSHVGSN